ncbi:MAG: M1 family metallopeptidase [Balneolaceae bacterium]|nr:M1 family metallopeptidase [Balneolaceae bacterium]
MAYSIQTRLILLFLLFSFAACGTTETAQQETVETEYPTVDQIERPLPYAPDVPMAFQRAIERETRSADGTPGESYWQNMAVYSLTAEIDPETHTLYGSSEVRYINNSPNRLEVIVVELAQNLHKEGTPKKDLTEITGGKTISHVSAAGSELNEITIMDRWTQRSAGYIIEGTTMYLFPEEELRSGEELELEFEWSFSVPQEGASGRMGRSRDNLYFIGYWYPHIAVYDDVYGWMDDPFVGNAEFYHGFAEYDLTVTMPGDWIVMGTGEFLNPEDALAEDYLERYNRAAESDETMMIADFDELDQVTRRDESGNVTWRFHSEKVRDVAFSATKASRWESSRTPVGDLTGDGETDYTRIHTFYRETAPLWSEQTEYARHSITFLSDYMNTPYPWPHMTSVEGAEIIGGGMEFPMITIIGDYNNAGAVRLYGVTAHELAHMWYPMIVSTNERRYTWIDEGYTSFHTNEANIDFYGDRFDHNDVFDGYLRIAGTDLEGEMMRWSDFHYPGPAFGVASYPKPASVLIALRGVLGEDLFMEAHHELIERWAYKHPYPWDIFNTIENVAGMDLSWFWRAWYYETWTLNQSVADVYEDGNETVIRIEDLGDVPMPVLLEITLEDGSTLSERIEADHWLKGFRTKDLRLELPSPVVKVEIDPDNHFPDIDTRNLIWERD